MDECLAELALQEVVTRLGGITVANGYFTDLGVGRITAEPTQQWDGASAYTVVYDTGEAVIEASSGRRTTASELDISIDFVVPVTLADPSRLARRGRADIARAMRTDIRKAAAGVMTITLVGSQKVVLDGEKYSNCVFAQVTARARLSDSTLPAQP